MNDSKKLKNKLTRVVSKAGLSWVTYSSIVDFAYELPGDCKTACWIFDPKSKKERVLFHAKFLAELSVPLLVLVLRHEFLHKAMYRNIKGATNLALVNYALDAAINKILFLSNPRLMINLAKILFPDTNPELADARLGITCVMNPSITTEERNKINSRLQNIFDEIYLANMQKREKIQGSDNYSVSVVDSTNADLFSNNQQYHYNKSIPEPLTLYNKLSSLLTPEQKREIEKMYEWIKAGGRGAGKVDNTPSFSNENNTSESENQEVPEVNKVGDTDDENYKHEKGDRVLVRGGVNKCRANDSGTLKSERKPLEELCGQGYSQVADLKAYFKKHVYAKKDSDSRGLKEFISKWQTEKQIETAISTIYNEVKNTSTLDTIPIDLTRTGFELVVLDVCGPEQIPLYFNENKNGAKKKICCYFDTSPSMHSFIPYMVSIADFFNSCEECEIAGGKYNGKYCFSEKVQGIKDWEEFVNGKVSGGCGTSFEIVVKHALERINEDEVDLVVIFTDGLSGINKNTIEEFNKTNKKCYTIYFTDPHQSYDWLHPRSREEKKQWQNMESDLDLLCGDQFTIFVDTEADKET